MSVIKKGRYSKYLRPVSVSFDILVLTVLFPYFYQGLGVNFIYLGAYQIAGWLAVAYYIGFYEVYRYTTPVEIVSKLIKQGVIFMLVLIAFFPFAKQTLFSGKVTSRYLIVAFIAITLFKFLLFYYLKRYRLVAGGNLRSAVIVGYNPDALRLKKLFQTRPDYGYSFKGFFTDKKTNGNVTGTVQDINSFVIENDIDEIYCSISEISNVQIKQLVTFAEENEKTIKFIPDAKDIFTKKLKLDYYEFFPVLSIRQTPLHGPLEKIVKRIFDIVFSCLVIVFILSWLTPLLAILIKSETRGPVFFKQIRNGLDYKEFYCYKFRSMRVNEIADLHQVSKNDPRITKIGAFLRKTSMDELPQFFNVLIGNMSVVGPRPHMISHTEMYANRVNKFMVRHIIKPGITGLAQTKGYRGEIETETDIINRVKYDIFYLENWSLLLDLKIIIQTVLNAVKGEAKAY